jgi:hypothetical protein
MRWAVLLFLVIAAACGQEGADGLAYQNWDPPGCGTYHMRRIQGTVTDPTGSPIGNVEISVFDDVSRKLLATAKTDEAGRFSIAQRWPGRLRVVFFSPGFRPENWAVTIVKWPGGGFFRARTIRNSLQLPVGDWVAICPKYYSRK